MRLPVEGSQTGLVKERDFTTPMSYSIYATVGNLILLCELDTEDFEVLFGPLNNIDRHKFVIRSP